MSPVAGLWMESGLFGFLAPVLNKQGTLDTSASMSSDIRQKLKNTSLPQLSRGLRWKALVTAPPGPALCQTHQNAPGWCRWVGVCPVSQGDTMKAASCPAFSILEHSTAGEGCDLPGQCQHAWAVQKCPPFSKPLLSGCTDPSRAIFWTSVTKQSHFLHCPVNVCMHVLHWRRPAQNTAEQLLIVHDCACHNCAVKVCVKLEFISRSFAPFWLVLAIKIQCAPTS